MTLKNGIFGKILNEWLVFRNLVEGNYGFDLIAADIQRCPKCRNPRDEEITDREGYEVNAAKEMERSDPLETEWMPGVCPIQGGFSFETGGK
jgi:hypothetical protein